MLSSVLDVLRKGINLLGTLFLAASVFCSKGQSFHSYQYVSEPHVGNHEQEKKFVELR